MVGHLVLAALSLAAGVVAIAWPGITALALTLCIGIWAVVTGVGEVIVAFSTGEPGEERALFCLGGLLSIALGVVLFARPALGAVSLAEVFGLFSLAVGITSLVMAARVHDTNADISALVG